jgi:hypothetical protein
VPTFPPSPPHHADVENREVAKHSVNDTESGARVRLRFLGSGLGGRDGGHEGSFSEGLRQRLRATPKEVKPSGVATSV